MFLREEGLVLRETSRIPKKSRRLLRQPAGQLKEPQRLRPEIPRGFA
jgi:hypothetical protein